MSTMTFTPNDDTRVLVLDGFPDFVGLDVERTEGAEHRSVCMNLDNPDAVKLGKAIIAAAGGEQTPGFKVGDKVRLTRTTKPSVYVPAGTEGVIAAPDISTEDLYDWEIRFVSPGSYTGELSQWVKSDQIEPVEAELSDDAVLSLLLDRLKAAAEVSEQQALTESLALIAIGFVLDPGSIKVARVLVGE